MKFDKTISTATARTGETASGELLDDLLAEDDVVVAPSGSRVRGRVDSVASSGKLAGAAQMTFRLTDLEVNGRWIPISTSAYERKATRTPSATPATSRAAPPSEPCSARSSAATPPRR